MFTKRIHVFKAGDQTSAQGVQRNFSDKDLEQVVKLGRASEAAQDAARESGQRVSDSLLADYSLSQVDK